MTEQRLLSPQPVSPGSNSEQTRAFFQRRVALYWKVTFFIVLSSQAIGVLELAAGVPLTANHALVALSTSMAGYFWRLCSHRERSLRFLRFLETEALLLHGLVGGFLVSYAAADFVTTRGAGSAESAQLVYEVFVLMAQGGCALLVAIRAALVPSAPRRTAIITGLFGLPFIGIPLLFSTSGQGAPVWRLLSAEPSWWLAAMSSVMWLYTIATCTVISSVIYGLRKEIRKARLLGQYSLGRKLGQGGMGEVFEARHGMMRRPSAIKLLREDQTGSAHLQRFEQEVQLTARLTHPNTITIFDYGRTADNTFYYAMELLKGATLQQVVEKQGPMAPGRVVRIVSMVCGALSEAHSLGLIHRDIKPTNIMLCTQGGEQDFVKLLDFGLVKELAVDHQVKLTQANTITGTPLYLSPEAIRDPETVDTRSDIYSLGVVAYFLLTGKELFDGKSVVEICSQHLHEAPKPMASRGVDVSPPLEQVVLRCLAKAPEDRPQSALELRQQLAACSVGSWSESDAKAWWSDHATDFETKLESAPSRKLAVDGARR